MVQRQPREPDTQSGAYKTYHHIACTGCGQLTRVEVCWPVVQASTLNKARFCPLCGTPFQYEGPSSANGTAFKLVARSMFGREPSAQEIQIVESIYPTWDAYQYPTLREYLKALISGKATA